MGSSVNGIGVNLAWFLLLLSCAIIASEQSGTRGGCGLITKNLTVVRPCCERVNVSVQACGGFCRSTNKPMVRLLGSEPNPIFTSKGHCCTIDEEQIVTGLDIYCDRAAELPGCESTEYNDEIREAKSCKCDQCM